MSITEMQTAHSIRWQNKKISLTKEAVYNIRLFCLLY